MKRRLFPIPILLLTAIIATMLFACTKGTEATEKDVPVPAVAEKAPTKVLFLGDSIGEGLAGPTPLTERENYAYYGIIGNINGYSYYNRAVTAYTTSDLLALVKQEDDGVNMIRSLITTADVIHISIVGNDFLISNHAQMMIDLADDNYARIIPRQTKAKANLEEIFTYIRSLNPNAVIITQTLYNPADENSPLVPASARSRLAAKGIGPEGYHDLVAKMVHEINKVLVEYRDEHATTSESGETVYPYELLDVYGAAEKLYTQDRTRWQSLFYDDGYHPSVEGHALIAALLQEKLRSLGLAAPNALHNYKPDKVSQLNRLYADLENKKEVRDAIMRAATFTEVSNAFFDGTRNIVPRYTEQPKKDGAHFDETKTFDLNYLSVYDFELTGLIDTENAKITFRANGKYELYVTKSMIKKNPINADDYFPFSIATLYFREIAPTVEKDDLEGLLRAITELYGLEIVGLDYDNPAVQAIFERYRTTGELIIDDATAFGDTLGLRSTGTYTLEKVTAADGSVYTAIYVNNLAGRAESYMRFTYRNEEVKESVRMTIEVAKLEIEGVSEKQ